jgi:hypothetical protein
LFTTDLSPATVFMSKCNTLYMPNRKKPAQRNVARLFNLTKCKKVIVHPRTGHEGPEGE